MTIKEPIEGEVAEPGVAYLAPGGVHMVLKKTQGKITIHFNSDSPENSCRPAADVLFRSAADVYGPNLLAVVMTGMGHDGMKGCQYINEKFGQIIAQDEDSSVIWGMPGAVVQAGVADAVLPLEKLGHEIFSRSRKTKFS
jgi:two-component system chemotaxis response regulator CheB